MSWNGQSVGSLLGIKFLIILTSLFGYYPAYFFLPFISLVYLLKSRRSNDALKDFYRTLAIHPTFIVLWKHYLSYALSFLHRTLFYLIGSKGLFFTTVGESTISNLTEKSGVLLLSAHIGGWEIGGELLVEHIDTPVNILAADRDIGALSSLNNTLSQKRKVSIISIDQDPLALSLAIREALGRKEIVAALGDRFVEGQSVLKVDFLGRETLFPKGLFEIALIEKVPIVPIFTTREKVNTYVFRACAPLWLKAKNRSERKTVIENAVKEYVHQLEKTVQQYPSQWYNFYRFWDYLKR